MGRDISLNDNPFFRAAVAEADNNEAVLQWIQERAEVVHGAVEVHDVLRHFGVTLRYPGSAHEEQISCPFHGKDNRPSCRVYPPDAQGPSHTWCYTCSEWLDCILMWKKFKGLDKYTHALREIEKTFGIQVPEPPPVAHKKESQQESEDLWALYEIVEKRLLGCRAAFTMEPYLRVGSVLDRLRTKMEHKQVSNSNAQDILRKILTKIGEKERAWVAV